MTALEELVEEGLRLHRAGDRAGARRCYDAALAGDPGHVRALRLLGVLLWQEGDAAGALEPLDRALALAPHDVAVLRARGAALLAAGRPDEAAAAFAEALEREPDDAETAFNLGLAERRLGRAGAALAPLRRAVELRPDLAAARRELELAEREAAPPPVLPPPVHLMIGTPCFGGTLTDHYAISLLKLQAACFERGLKLSFCLLHGDALITRARNSVVAEFLKDRSATHLLFIDADIGFRPAQVFRLLEAGREMAAAVYPVKALDWERVGRSVRAGEADPPEGALDYVVEFVDAEGRPSRHPVDPENGFARARYAGTGFLLVARAVFERMAAAHPGIKYRRSHATADADVDPGLLHAFFDCRIDPDSGVYLSEDFTFCQRWIEMGGEIWVDLRSRLDHVGRFAFEGNLTNRYRHLLPGGRGVSQAGAGPE